MESLSVLDMFKIGIGQCIGFDPARDILFLIQEILPFHSNGLAFCATFNDGSARTEIYYSVGGGFVVQ